MSEYRFYWVNYKLDIATRDMPCISFEYLRDSILVWARSVEHAKQLAVKCLHVVRD